MTAQVTPWDGTAATLRRRATARSTEQFLTLAQQEMVGHPGNVVAHHPVTRLILGQFGIVLRHAIRMIEEKGEKRIQRGDGTVALLGNGRMGIDARVEKLLQARVLPGYIE